MARKVKTKRPLRPSEAAVPRRRQTVPKRPAALRKPFAVVASRLVGEYDTRAEADAAQAAYPMRRDEFVCVLSKQKGKK